VEALAPALAKSVHQHTQKDLLNGELGGMKGIWSVFLFGVLLIVGVALYNNVSQSSDLTATKTNCSAHLPFSTVTVSCIEFKNKGEQPMLLQKLRVNRRSDAACNPTINKSLKTGDIYYFAYNKPLVGPFCGEPVKIEVETDNGSRNFSW
jgi:hypothetical protein